jgi:hypothetical protein
MIPQPAVRPKRRNIALTLLEHVANYGHGDLDLAQALTLVDQSAFDAEDVHVLVGTDTHEIDVEESEPLRLPLVNSLAFRQALVRTWREANFYLRAFGFAIVAIPKEMAASLQRVAESGDAGANLLDVHIVRPRARYGRMYEDEDGLLVYEPRDTALQARYEYGPTTNLWQLLAASLLPIVANNSCSKGTTSTATRCDRSSERSSCAKYGPAASLLVYCRH